MNRREFIQSFAMALAAGAVTGEPVLAAGDGWKEEFAAALSHKPWLLGFKGVTTDSGFKRRPLRIEGTLPEALRGVFYRNGPARHEIGDMRYHHWFDGDGMVQAFQFDGGGVSHRCRFVETAKMKEETAAGRALIQGLSTALPSMGRPASPDAMNTANINVIEHNGELLALWEGGSAYRLDPETLETLGLKSWSAETTGLPFSAHPRIDTDGTLWNFGYATTVGALVIYRISADGRLLDTGILRRPMTPMVHDFLITSRHLILITPPFVFDATREGAVLDHFVWRPEDGGRAFIIDKNDLSSIREVAVPPFWVFHFANGFEDAAGEIHFDAPIYQTPHIMTSTFRDVMRGRETASDGATLMAARLNPTSGKFSMTPVSDSESTEFPRIDLRKQGRRHRYTYLTQNRGREMNLTFDTILKFDHLRERSQSFTFGSSEFAEEHIFVPNPNSADEDEGWLLGTSLDYEAGATTLNVFDAKRIAVGPIARMKMDYALPAGLHGNFHRR